MFSFPCTLSDSANGHETKNHISSFFSVTAHRMKNILNTNSSSLYNCKFYLKHFRYGVYLTEYKGIRHNSVPEIQQNFFLQ